jgi:putative endonuclease
VATHGGAVYIMSSAGGVLYTGVTADLPKRVWEHRTNLVPDFFTARYSVHLLVYYEAHTDIRDAIQREKQIKGWRRSKKVALIESINRTWSDLSEQIC